MSGVAFTWNDAKRIAGAVQWAEGQRGLIAGGIDSQPLRPGESWVRTPASLPDGYDGTDALEGVGILRLADGTDHDLNAVWIKDTNGSALEASKVYRGTFNGTLSQADTNLPLFLVQAGGGGGSSGTEACAVAPWRWETIKQDVDGTPTNVGKYLIHARDADMIGWDEADHWTFTSYESQDFFLLNSWGNTSCLPILSMANNSLPSSLLDSVGSRNDLEDMCANWCQRNIRCHGARLYETFVDQSTYYFVNSANSHKIYPKVVLGSDSFSPPYPTYNIQPVIYNTSFSLTMIDGVKYAVYTRTGYNHSGTSKTYYELYPDPFNLLGAVTEGSVVSASGNTLITPISYYSGASWSGPSITGQGLARYIVGRR
jgi:hypothetical protein